MYCNEKNKEENWQSYWKFSITKKHITMRDKLKSKKHFDKKIKFYLNSIDKYTKKLEEGKVKEDRIKSVEYSIVFFYYIKVLMAMYSRGDSLSSIKELYVKRALPWMVKVWDDKRVKFHGNKRRVYYDFYFYDDFIYMLWMISFGILLEVPLDNIKSLAKLLDRGNIKNIIYDTLLAYRLKDRPISPEVGTFKPYIRLKAVLEEEDKKKASRLLKQYLQKYWYRNHKNAFFYDTHKVRNGELYDGYWSFESAAIVKVLGLDDSSFRENQYYPKDLVDYDPEKEKEYLAQQQNIKSSWLKRLFGKG